MCLCGGVPEPWREKGPADEPVPAASAWEIQAMGKAAQQSSTLKPVDRTDVVPAG